MRILLAEDDALIASAILSSLRKHDFSVDWVSDGLAVDGAVQAHDYGMLILDLGLPHVDGIEILKRLAQRSKPLPVLVITARDSVADRVKGLDAGADDYLVKPFDLDELSARVRALLRRQGGRASPVLDVGPLSLDPAAHTVTLDGAPVALSKREFSLLHALMKQPGVPLSRAQIEESLYGWGEEVESNAVEVHIHALRRKIGAERIRNVRGVGYMVPAEP